jgi:hypothetical protein
MTGLLRHARHEAVALARNEAHTFAARHALVHYASGAIYSFIPKNGCSTLRYSLAAANNCIAGPDDWTWIHPNNETFAARLADLVRAPYSFVVVRCPHARLASVFLDKLVDKTPEFWQLYRLTRDGFEPDGLTFRAFVALLEDRALRKANIHWRAQTDFLVYERYTDVFALDRFGDAVRTLQDRIGFGVMDARHLTRHGTDAVDLVSKGCFADAPIAELAAMKREGRLPSHKALYDKALRGRVSRLYADDLTFYTDTCGRGGLTFPKKTVT